jgi:hypothetical protein
VSDAYKVVADALMEDSPFARAARRQRNSVLPMGGRQEGTATALLDSIGSAIPNKLGGLGQAMTEYSAQEFPGTHGVTSQTTDYDARRNAADWAAGTAMNMVGVPAMTGGVPADALGSAAKGIKAYHGSPHDFDRFDMSRIGTGEGAQAYGHGLYFAENEGVARAYRDALGDAATIKLDGVPISDVASSGYKVPYGTAATPEQKIADIVASYGTLQKARFTLANRHPDLLPIFDDLEKSGRLSPGGRMYEVNINARPEEFLDWDKPLQQQPSVVQDLARSADLSHLQPGNRTRVMLEKFRAGQEQPTYLATGHTLHNALEDYGMKPKPELSAYLKDQGIPGIRYLDQGSRWAGGAPEKIRDDLRRAQQMLAESPNKDYWRNEIAAHERNLAESTKAQTRNYVVFDDKLIDILKKYGITGMLGGGGMAAGVPIQDPQ